MALLKCSECETMVSEYADKCPNCGCPISIIKMNQEVNEKTTQFRKIILTNIGVSKVKVIKVIREITGLGLKEAKELVENTPSEIIGGITEQDATNFEKMFLSEGAKIEIKLDLESTEKYDVFKFLREKDTKSIPKNAKASKQPSNIPKCPKCGSTAITAGQRGYTLLTGFLGSNKTVNRCSNCGHTWKPGK